MGILTNKFFSSLRKSNSVCWSALTNYSLLGYGRQEVSFTEVVTPISGIVVGSGVFVVLSVLDCSVPTVRFSSLGCSTMIGEDTESTIHPENRLISLHSIGAM